MAGFEKLLESTFDAGEFPKSPSNPIAKTDAVPTNYKQHYWNISNNMNPEFWISNEFSNSQVEIMLEAISHMINRMYFDNPHSNIIQETDKASLDPRRTDQYSRGWSPEVRQGLLMWIAFAHNFFGTGGPEPEGDLISLTPSFPITVIDPFESDELAGQAGINIWTAGNLCTMDLNINDIGDSSLGINSDPKYWAGVIAHEMLHTFGWEHPSGYRPEVYMEAWSNYIMTEHVALARQDLLASRHLKRI